MNPVRAFEATSGKFIMEKQLKLNQQDLLTRKELR